MPFTHDEILNKKFSKSIRGYDIVEVEAYLEVVAENLKNITIENESLKRRISSLENSYDEFSSEKKGFAELQQRTQKELKDLKLKAEKEAKLIILDAKLKSEDITNKYYKELGKVRQEIDELKQLRSSFVTRFKNILRQQLDTIELYSSEMRRESNK